MLEEEKNELENAPQEETQPTEETTSVEETTETEAPQEEAAETEAPAEVEAKAEEATETEAPAEVEAKAEEATKTEAATAEETQDDDEDETDGLDDLGENPNANQGPHDEFDWTLSNKELPYSQDQIDSYLNEYESTMTALSDNELVKGVVTAISGGDVVLDIGYKSDGLISTSEFRDTPDLGVGDSVEVYIERQEDERGQLVISRRKAKLLRAMGRY